MSILPKWIYKFNSLPIKISAGLLAEINKLILKFIWKCKGPRRAKTISKKEQNWETHTSQFRNFLQSYSNQDSAEKKKERKKTDSTVLAEDKNRIKSPEIEEIGSRWCRVEGRALTPSCESTRITTNCRTIISRKTLELTKKDTPHPKMKEKPQWNSMRGAITIISNPITAGWVTHKLENTYTTEVHPLEWRFWAPHQASQPGGPAMGRGIPTESDFES